MEKKKLILVAVSVGVFLVIVISASILIFTPKPSGGEGRIAATKAPGTVVSAPRPIPAGTGARDTDVAAKGIDDGARDIDDNGSLRPEPIAPARTQPASADVVDMVRNADGLPGLQPPPFTAADQENNYYISGEGVISIDVRPRVTAGVPNTSSAAPQAAPASPVAKPPAAPAAKPAAVVARPPAVKPASKPAAAKPAPSPARSNNDYWVQIGAFSAKVRAEGVKETLASMGITTIIDDIDDRDADGRTLYRVRVGPYTSETEAGYWLALVKEIHGFADSQIRASVRR